MNIKNLILIDGNALMHRSYHGVGKGFTPMFNGMPVGMVYGFTASLMRILEEFDPTQCVVTFDTKEKTFRHEMCDDYKANRSKAPDDFYPQLPYIFELLESFAVPILKKDGYESDDIIGTLVERSVPKKFEVKIMSHDMDFLQLVSDQVKLVKFFRNGERPSEMGVPETIKKYGITPDKIIDFKALSGDSSDNYKGIEGLGPKTATKLLNEFDSIEGIYDNLGKLPEKLRIKFETQQDYLLHCKTLATIHTGVPIEFDLDSPFAIQEEKAQEFLEKMSFHSLAKRFSKMNNIFDQKEIIVQKNSSKEDSPNIQQSLF